MTDTIFAQATAVGRAGIAVIRISGPRAFDVAEALAGQLPEDRRAGLRWLRDSTGARIDQALVLCFSGPKSFTGEDVAELHVHGGIAVCRMVADCLMQFDGVRLAEPGEFSRRALMNGRLDLAEVEGLGDLLSAETVAQQRQAMQLMSGALSQKAGDWRERLVRALALVEATIDFADDDVPEDAAAIVLPDLVALLEEFGREMRGAGAAERLRVGFEVALVGAPNVGKSTLLNRIARREVAITSPIAGTTRDVIEVRLDLGGLPVTMLDLAGIRDEGDGLEQLGIARARERAADSDLRIFLVEGEEAPDIAVRPGDLVVQAKADLGGEAEGLAVSGFTGAGVEEVLAAVRRELGSRVAGAGLLSHGRQVRAIEMAASALEATLEQVRQGRHPELAAAELRRVLRALDFLVGSVDVEAVLDVIFASFCLGK